MMTIGDMMMTGSIKIDYDYSIPACEKCKHKKTCSVLVVPANFEGCSWCERCKSRIFGKKGVIICENCARALEQEASQ